MRNETQQGHLKVALRATAAWLRTWAPEMGSAASLVTMLVVSVSAISYCNDSRTRRTAQIMSAWTTINNAQGQRADAGRSAAIQHLWNERQDLIGLTLDGARLSGLDLRHGRIEGLWTKDTAVIDSEIQAVTFAVAKLVETRFINCGLDRCAFLDCELELVEFIDGGQVEQLCISNSRSVAGISLRGLRLGSFRIVNSNLSRVQFDGAQILDSQLIASNIAGSTFARAELTRVVWSYIDASKTKWNSSTLVDCKFDTQTRLSAADFSNALLRNVVFANCDLGQANPDQPSVSFYNSELDQVEFRRCNLAGVNLREIRSSSTTVTIVDCAGLENNRGASPIEEKSK